MGVKNVVASSAMRLAAGASVLIAGLLMCGAQPAVAFADTGHGAAAGAESDDVTSKVDSNDGNNNSASGATHASEPAPPKSTVGNGREDIDVQSNGKKENGPRAPIKKLKASVTIPILRIPRQSEMPAHGWPDPRLFYTTLEIPVPALGDFLTAVQAKPRPSPPPGPTFKTQEQQREAPPVADSGGGGVDPLAAGVAAEPPVLHAPMVIAPLPIPLPAAPAPAGPVGPAAGAIPPPVVADAAAAPADVPLIRGSPAPAMQLAAEPLTPTSGQATRVGYPRYLSTTTAGDLAVLALPGAAGLLVLTLSGGVIGYRQANSARVIRTQSAARFLR
jgi:hypothetical protein